MKNELKTPPPFVRCDECKGTGEVGGPTGCAVKNGVEIEMDSDMTCPKCKNSPLPGWLPQWYTPEQWVEYVRRENNLPDYELPDDMPVWVYEHFKYYGNLWTERLMIDLRTIEEKEGDMPDNPVVIATDAGRPPEDWR